MRILLIDDNPVLLKTVATMLRKCGHEAVLAEDGNQAWERLQQEAIRFVISDWMMPGLDGPDLCRRVRNSAFDYYIYFMLLTGREGKESLVQGMDAGADDFLVKPVDHEELRVRVRAGERILELEHMLAERNRKLDVTNQELDAANRKLDNANRTMRHDLESAAVVQKALLPAPATLDGIRFEWLFLPSNLLAGDTFGYFNLDDRFLGFYLLDVAGHGIPSALLSFTLNKTLSQRDASGDGLLRHNQPDAPYYRIIPPAEVLQELNHRFQEDSESFLYFTMVYGVIDTHSGTIDFIQAGHPAPLRQQGDGQCESLGEGGFPVGLLPTVSYEAVRMTLAPGERLFLYSDGVTDCTNSQGDSFTLARLQALLAESRELPLSEAVHCVGQSLRAWKGDEVFQDDISLLGLERYHY